MNLRLLIPFLLILNVTFALANFSQAQAQHSLELQRVAWNHTTLTVFLTQPKNESWWAPYYLNATLRAINQWNHAFLNFAFNYSDYEYLSNLRMIPTVDYAVDSGFDVYISWTQNPISNAGDIGLTITPYDGRSGIVINSTIQLASKTFQGSVLSEVDMQNVAAHELGHSLGLGHCNYTGDVLYPQYTLNPLVQQVRPLSTLDLYGVATVFQWMSTSSLPYSPKQSSVTLPTNLTYQYLPLSSTDLPATSSNSPWQNLLNGILNFLSSILGIFTLPEIILLIVAVSALVVAFILTRQKKQKNAKN